MPVPGYVADTSSIETRWVEYTSAGTVVRAYLARPKSGLNGSGIVVLHDAFGPGEHFQDICRRFANLGYIALCPDMYVRVGGIQDPENREEVFGKHLSLKDSDIVADVAGAAGFIRREPGFTGKVGAIGYCAGGRQVLLVSCSTDILDAGVSCWGGSITRATPTEDRTPNRPVRPVDLVPYMANPVFMVIGETDHDPSPEMGQEVWARMQEHGKAGRLKIYPEAGHAFFADYRPAAYKDAQAHELWKDSLEFFQEHLLS